MNPRQLKALFAAVALALPLLAQAAPGLERRKAPKRSLQEIQSGMPVGRVAYDPRERGDWLLSWYGGRPSVDYLKARLGIVQREMERYPDLLPGRDGGPLAGAAPGGAQAAAASWRSIGPLKEPILGTRPDMDSGRLVDIVTHPTDPQILYVATAAGGVFKTTNASFAASAPWNWTSITDSIASTSSGGSTSVGALAMSPADPNILYLGMGDREGATVGNSASDAIGFYRSTDGGTTWSAPVVLGNTTLTYAILPLSASVILVGGNDGLYRSTDGGSTFTKILSGIATSSVWSIQAFSATDVICSQWATAAGKILYSADGGATWTLATLTGLPVTPSRMTVATSAASTTQGWAIAADSATGNFAKGLLKTVDKGHTWTYVAAPVGEGSLFQAYTSYTQFSGDGGQGTYNHGLAVDPADANKVWAGANHALYRTLDGGTTWVQMAYGYDANTVYAHPDWHCSAWSKTGSILYMGNDGGLAIIRDPYRTPVPKSNSSAAQPSDPTYIDNRWNQGLNSYQIWKFGNTSASNPTGSKDRMVIGLQDNSTRVRVDDGAGLTASTSFDAVAGGDGTGGNMHAVNGNMAMGAQPYLSIFRTTTNWAVANYAYTGITERGSSSSAPFVANLVPDLSDSTGNTIYTHSYLAVYKTTTYGTSWTALGTTGIEAGRSIRNLAVAKSSPSTLAVVTSGGLGFTSTDGGASWTPFGSFTNNALSMSFVWFDTGNAQILYAGSVAQNPTATHLWKSVNGGASWTAIDTNPGFPAGLPVECLVNDPTNPSTLYAGTDIGVYRSDDKGATWARYGSGFPLANVKDLYIAPDGSFLRAATFGRGAWEILTSGSAPSAPAITSFAPTSGAVGTAVTLTGTGFTGATAVRFNGTLATLGTVTDTTLATTVPAGAGSGTISVTTPSGTGTSAGTFTVTTAPGAPTITSFAPTTGGVGTAVTLTGTGFTGATAVRFNGTLATLGTVTSTSISTTVPAGATTGTLSVTTPSGTGTSTGSFTVTVPVTISILTSPTYALVGGQLSFTAVVSGSSNAGVTWGLLGGGGTLNSATANPVTFTAPSTPGLVELVAHAAADSSALAFVFITTWQGDVLDLATIARAWGSHAGDGNWNASADLNKDGTVDASDLTLFYALAGF